MDFSAYLLLVADVVMVNNACLLLVADIVKFIVVWVVAYFGGGRGNICLLSYVVVLHAILFSPRGLTGMTAFHCTGRINRWPMQGRKSCHNDSKATAAH